MPAIKNIIIIYNPNSTGDSKKNAQQFAQAIATHTSIPTRLQPTKSAGHAEKIVKAIRSSAVTMVVSSSGDGGYHEVINGILSRKDMRDMLIAGLLPSGNANDHYHAVHHGDIIKRIENSDIQTIDVLKVQVGDWTRYAHSYAGIGMTPHVGEKLTEARLTRWNEIWLTMKYLLTTRSVKIRVDRQVRRYDSLVFSNIGRMSKYMTLSKEAAIDDGKFEVTGVKSGSLGHLLSHLFKASTVGLTNNAHSITRYAFTSFRPLALQLDGEVYHFDSGVTVTISTASRALRCIV